MTRKLLMTALAALATASAWAQAPQRPQFETKKVDGTDNVYVFRYLNRSGPFRRGMIDFHPLESEQSLKRILAMDWERMIPGHPGLPDGRLGTKEDVQNVLTLLQDASAAVKVAAREGKCWDPAEKEVKLPKYEKWPGYENNLQFVTRRYCGLWGRGT